MTQYNTFNKNFSNSKLNKLKTGSSLMKNAIRINSSTISNRLSYSEKNLWLRYDKINNFKSING